MRRHFHPAALKIEPALFLSLLSLLPEAAARVHLKDCQGPGVHIHPAGGTRAFCLLTGAVFRRIAHALLRVRIGSGISQAKIRYFGIPLSGKKQISGFHILMQQSVGMGIHKAPRRLDRDIQDPLLHFLRSPAVEGLVPDPVLQASSVHPLRKDRRNAADLSDIITGHDVGVEPQTDPVLTLPEEILPALRTSFGKESGPGTLHGQFQLPSLMVDLPDTAHAARDGIGNDLIGIKDRIALLQALCGDRILLPAHGILQRREA